MSGLDEIERQITSSPASRARLLADTLDILERQGVDTTSEGFRSLVSADISREQAFRGALAASTVVIVIGTGGRRAASGAGTAASTVVIAIASAGQRPTGNLGAAASTVVIAIASAGQRPAGNMGTAASTVVVAIASAGQRPTGNMGTAASTVVIAIASAGQRPVGIGRNESTSEDADGGDSAMAKLPSIEKLADISNALRQLADLVDAGQIEITQEVGRAFQDVLQHYRAG